MIRLGLYYDLRNPGDAREWHSVYAGALERIAHADSRGLDAVWLTEHHGFSDGYLPAPLTFAAAIAARTSGCRIGTAVVVAPLTRESTLAEQAAVVDILSGGRLELGLGAGWRSSEFAALNIDFGDRYRILADTVHGLPECWSSGRVTPAPIQRPLPTWIGARGPRGAHLAGRLGAGLLWIDRALLPSYLDGLRVGGHDPATARMGGLVNIFLADDPDAAFARIRDAGRHNRQTYRGAERAGETAFPKLRVLTAEAAARHIREQVEGLPVTDVFCFGDLGGLGADLVDRHIELLTGVVPGLLSGQAERSGS